MKPHAMQHSTLEDAISHLLQAQFKNHHNQGEGFLYRELMRRVERCLIREVLNVHHGNQSRAAKHLGISRTTLRKKMLELNIEEEC